MNLSDLKVMYVVLVHLHLRIHKCVNIQEKESKNVGLVKLMPSNFE